MNNFFKTLVRTGGVNMVNRNLGINTYQIFKRNFSNSNYPKRMRAVLQTGIGGYETLYIGETDVPKLKEDEVLVKVEAFALNRADIAQRQGKHSPQKGMSNVLGKEKIYYRIYVKRDFLPNILHYSSCGYVFLSFL